MGRTIGITIRRMRRRLVPLALAAFLAYAAIFTGISGLTAAYAKGSLASGDSVHTVLVYEKNSSGQNVLLSQLDVGDMMNYLNDNLSSYGAVHNYSVLDRYTTPVHQEAQGFSADQLLSYAVSKSGISGAGSLGLDFTGNDKISFWGIDGTGFSTQDTYTYTDLYGVQRYNFPALYANWDFQNQKYKNQDAIWASRETETPLLSITGYSQRYFLTDAYSGGGTDMENYFDSKGLLDTAKTMRLMLPMTQSEFENQTSTAANSRYGICYILYDMSDEPSLNAGKVDAPTYTVRDGGDGYWYFSFSCDTDGATIYYNSTSESSYMPTTKYTAGEEVKVAKTDGKDALINYCAVKDGCTDAGIQTATSAGSGADVAPPGTSAWDGTSVDTSWYTGHESDSTYTITTAAQLAGLEQLVNGTSPSYLGTTTFAGKTIVLGANVDMAGYNWEPIGNDRNIPIQGTSSIDHDYYNEFSGTFDGGGHTVYGVHVSHTGYNGTYEGFFGKVTDADIENLTVSGSVGNSSTSFGAGIAGYLANSTIMNCVNKATVNSWTYGGIADLTKNSTIKDCINKGNLTATNGSSVGGIIGADSSFTSGGTVVEDCTNTGSVFGSVMVGGIIGDGSWVKCSGCRNYGSITTNGTYAGGITGQNGIIDGCKNYGAVSSTVSAYVGGISGATSTISGSANYGSISAVTNDAGGISGAGSACTECVNYGSVTAAGGAAGGIEGDTTGALTACANFGSISGLKYIGGISGLIRGSADSCFNEGTCSLTGTGYTSVGSLTGDIYVGTVFKNSIDLTGTAFVGTAEGIVSFTNCYYLKGGMEDNTAQTTDYQGLDALTGHEMRTQSLTDTLGCYDSSGNGNTDGYYSYTDGNYPMLHFLTKSVTLDSNLPDSVEVTDPYGNEMVLSNGSYSLYEGATYDYLAVASGYQTVSGSFKAGDSSTLTVNLTQKSVQGITTASDTYEKPYGASFSLKATADGDGTLSYASSDKNVVRVSSSGTVTPVATGTADIIIKASETYGYASAEKTVHVTIVKGTQTVTAGASSYTKAAGSSAFSLGAKTTGDGTVSYKSSVTSVATVSAAGKVTAKAPGSTVITITASGTANCQTASKTVKVIVTPKKQSLSSVKNSASKKLKITWKKDSTVSGYQIRYSASKSFSSAKTVLVKKYSTTSATVSKLTKKKTYYVQVRAYKTISGKAYYGAWSSVKYAKVKK